MTIELVARLAQANILAHGDHARDVTCGYACDLLSWVQGAKGHGLGDGANPPQRHRGGQPA